MDDGKLYGERLVEGKLCGGRCFDYGDSEGAIGSYTAIFGGYKHMIVRYRKRHSIFISESLTTYIQAFAFIGYVVGFVPNRSRRDILVVIEVAHFSTRNSK